MPESELKLLPCPYCCGNAMALTKLAQVVCIACQASTSADYDGYNTGVETAIEKWNTRAKDPEKEALIATLEGIKEKSKFRRDIHTCNWIFETVEAALKSAGGERNG